MTSTDHPHIPPTTHDRLTPASDAPSVHNVELSLNWTSFSVATGETTCPSHQFGPAILLNGDRTAHSLVEHRALPHLAGTRRQPHRGWMQLFRSNRRASLLPSISPQLSMFLAYLPQ